MKRPPEVLTEDEARALLHAPSSKAPTGVRNRALIAVLYGAGLRISEALALKPSDIDVDTGMVRVLHGKGDAARTIGIDAGALVHVVRWIEMRRGLGLRGRWLFCTLKGGPVSSTYVRAMFKRVARRTSIEKRVHPHGLRHTHAVELNAAGFSPWEIKQQLGHANLATTAIYLDHLAPSAHIAKVHARRTVI